MLDRYDFLFFFCVGVIVIISYYNQFLGFAVAAFALLGVLFSVYFRDREEIIEQRTKSFDKQFAARDSRDNPWQMRLLLAIPIKVRILLLPVILIGTILYLYSEADSLLAMTLSIVFGVAVYATAWKLQKKENSLWLRTLELLLLLTISLPIIGFVVWTLFIRDLTSATL